MAVTVLNAGCVPSNNFLPAVRYWPSAPNDSAAWAFCSAESVLRVPNQVKQTLTAAIVVRRRSAASTFGVSVVAGSSKSNVDIRSFLVEKGEGKSKTAIRTSGVRPE